MARRSCLIRKPRLQLRQIDVPYPVRRSCFLFTGPIPVSCPDTRSFPGIAKPVELSRQNGLEDCPCTHFLHETGQLRLRNRAPQNSKRSPLSPLWTHFSKVEVKATTIISHGRPNEKNVPLSTAHLRPSKYHALAVRTLPLKDQRNDAGLGQAWQPMWMPRSVSWLIDQKYA